MDKAFDFSEESIENTVEVIADEGLVGMRADAATATVCENRLEIMPSNLARSISGMPDSLAAASSGLSGWMAEVYTTICASRMFSAL